MTLLFPFRDRVVDAAGMLTTYWERAMRSLEQSYGRFVVVPHDASMFTGNGSMTWTVEVADLVTLVYTLMGKRLEVFFTIRAAAVGGTPAGALRILIPGKDANGNAFVSARTITTPVYVEDASTPAIGLAYVQAGVGYIHIAKLDGTNWTAGVNRVEGSIVLEVQ